MASKHAPVVYLASNNSGQWSQVIFDKNQINLDPVRNKRASRNIACYTPQSKICIIHGGAPKNYDTHVMCFSPDINNEKIPIFGYKPEPCFLLDSDLHENLSSKYIDNDAKLVENICDATVTLREMRVLCCPRSHGKMKKSEISKPPKYSKTRFHFI